jgi:hypothetical protein
LPRLPPLKHYLAGAWFSFEVGDALLLINPSRESKTPSVRPEGGPRAMTSSLVILALCCALLVIIVTRCVLACNAKTSSASNSRTQHADALEPLDELFPEC